MSKEQLKQEYKLLAEYYGIYSSIWDQIHTECNRYSFCKENRKLLISEYLIWEELTERLRKHQIPYYMGIDTFLEEYKEAVYNCLNI